LPGGSNAKKKGLGRRKSRGRLSNIPVSQNSHEQLKTHTPEAERYLIDGKWITAEERQAEISRLKAEISENEESLRICLQARYSATELIRLARKGNKLFIGPLFEIACDLVSALNSIASKHPKLILPISRDTPLWPALISRKRAWKRCNVKLMDALQLGEGDVYSTKKWQVEASFYTSCHRSFRNGPSKRESLALATAYEKQQEDMVRSELE
jgi:hypothetical protein